MAGAINSLNIDEEISQLQVVFGNISLEDCLYLIHEFGNEGLMEVTRNVYEAMEASHFESVSDFLSYLKEDSNHIVEKDVPRSSSFDGRSPKKDPWALAKSKSSNAVQKTLKPNPNLFTGSPNSGQLELRRFGKNMDESKLRSILAKYLQDPAVRGYLTYIHDKRNQNLLIILRGASGSGKSTLANLIWCMSERGEICSADQYFVNRAGQYNFNRNALKEAHEFCRQKCKDCLSRLDSPVIIDNTNTRVDEMIPYVQLALEKNYEIFLMEPKTDWKSKAGILAQKNIHGVPRRAIEDQLERFETTTVSSMIERVQRRQGNSRANYKPSQELDWGFGGDRALSDGRGIIPMELLTSSFGTMGLSSSENKSKLPSTSPTAHATSYWTDPPPQPPQSPLLLSDLVPDLCVNKNGGTPKPKRTAKRHNSNGNPSAGTVAVSTTKPKPVPLPFEDPQHVEFGKLCKLFSSVPKDELDRLFNLYEGNVDECASALMDEGWEMSDPVSAPVETESNAIEGAVGYDCSEWSLLNGMIDPVGSNVEKVSPVEFENGEETDDFSVPAGAESYSEGSVADEESDPLELVLPIEFARLLLCQFGHPDDERRTLTIDELSVKLPADVAFDIYKSLYLNMHQAEVDSTKSNASEQSSRSGSPSIEEMNDEEEFNAMAISLSQMEMETNSENPQLATIMNLETKISKHNQDSLQRYSAKNRTMAQNIQFSMLKQEYPFLDPSVVDEVYSQCHLDTEKARSWFAEMYPQSLAQLRSCRATPATSSWSLKYNPKDVQLYSMVEMKQIEAKHDELEEKWMAKMNKMRQNYAKVQISSCPKIKAHYMIEAKNISEEMKALADEMQYYKALQINARHKNDQILDLHGLKINGAMRVLKEFLQYKEDEFRRLGTPKMILLIITGQGKHSKNGSPVLQPAVRNFLTQRKYRYHVGQPGTYSVILTRSTVVRNKKSEI